MYVDTIITVGKLLDDIRRSLAPVRGRNFSSLVLVDWFYILTSDDLDDVRQEIRIDQQGRKKFQGLEHACVCTFEQRARVIEHWQQHPTPTSVQ